MAGSDDLPDVVWDVRVRSEQRPAKLSFVVKTFSVASSKFKVITVVSGGLIDMTCPLCPYPQVAKWKGVGSTNDAENFVCGAK